jgi:hypothetical protein
MISDASVKALFVRLSGGLCNRIMPAMSALFMAHKLEVPVAFRWVINPGCLCPADKLIKPNLTWGNFTGPYLRYKPSIRQSRIDFINALRTETTLRLRSAVFFDDFHKLYPDEYENWISENIEKYFTPIDELATKIASFSKQHFRSNMIGVHVRLGDKSGWTRNLPKIDQYFEAIDNQATRRCAIFLATDDGCDEKDSEVISQFKKKYGKMLTYRPKCSIMRDMAGIQDAFIDLWLLRKCNRLIGTTTSTYSLTAGLGRPTIILRSQP